MERQAPPVAEDRLLPVHLLFARRAASMPRAIAASLGGEQMSYSQLDRRANSLAHQLRELGAEPESTVGVCLPRGLDLPVALLGVLKAGAAYVPMDPDVPFARPSSLLASVGVRLAVVSHATAGRLAAADVEMVRVDAAQAGAYADRDPSPRAALDALAYVIHTSGATGEPKPVAVPHRGLANHARVLRDLCGLGAGDRVVQFASISFDAAAEELYPTWLAGARVVLLPAAAPTAHALERLLVAQQVTVLNLPTSYWHQWARELASGGRHLPASVRLVVIGGEAADSEIARLWLRHTSVPLLNTYGVTEATISSTAHWVKLDTAGEATVPIGHPIAGIEAHVLDTRLDPVPSGRSAELYIGGTGLARGYHGRPGLTAERFLPHPHAATPGARVYRTGDRVRQLQDGSLQFLGRTDDQIKLRGHRIEPAEVESALVSHPQVALAHVTAEDDSRLGRRMVAYVVPRDRRRVPGAQQLRRHLGDRLPSYLQPQAYVVLDALPLTPHGKVDRAALPVARPAARAALRAPGTDLERRLASIWEEVFGVAPVGVDDDFFDLGGHSLLGTQIAARARQVLQAEISQQELFANPTVARLARRLASGPPAGPVLPPLGKRPHEGRAPLSAQQEQVWFLSRLAPSSIAYQAQTTIRVVGPLDLALLGQAVTELARRHEILRTTFEEADGRPWQVIHPPQPVRIAHVDLCRIAESEREPEAERIVWHELRAPFDLSRLPLARWTAIQLAADELELVLVEHHLVHDGWSFALLIRELTALYSALASAEESPLRDPPVQYADFASWQREALGSAAMRAQLAYWLERLEDVPAAVSLPVDRPRPGRQAFRGELVRVETPVNVWRALRLFCQTEGVTPFMTLFAAFVALLHRYSGSEDICVGSGFANRRLRETEALLGMLVNTVVLRCEVSGASSFQDLVQQVRGVVLEAVANQELPFAHLVREMNPERDLAVNPAFQVMFSFDDSPLPQLDFAGSPATLFERHNGSSKVDLNVIAVPRAERQVGDSELTDGRTTLLWEYDADIYDGATVERMADHHLRLLAGGIRAPRAALSDLPLLGPEQRQTILDTWSGTGPVQDSNHLVHQLFTRQAAATPDAPAVSFGDRRLMYAELDTMTDRLAHQLRELGAGPEQIVAVAMERSVELVAALLAVLKADAAYLALDLTDPPARVSELLADAGASLVITSAEEARRLPASGARILVVDGLVPSRPPVRAPQPRAHPDSLAYLVYTSGSSGRPKAVAAPHRAVVRLVSEQSYARMGAGEVHLLHSPVSFDASTFEIWGALLNGGHLAIAPPHQLSTADFTSVLRRFGVTTLFLTTGLFHAVVDEDVTALRPVRQLLTGGEPVSSDHLERARRALPGCRLMDVYGPTETTTFACFEALAVDRPVQGPVAIGRPIVGTEAYILDEQHEPIPAGMWGELCLGGAGLARGYLGRPDLTAERFIPHPHARRPGVRLYRTGDLARWRSDGSIELGGRLDDQVKLRGHRVEPGEIAAVIGGHPRVASAHVTAQLDPETGQKHLVAYVVTAGPSPTVSSLCEHVGARLPRALVPQFFVCLDELPLTPNGKVDRGALPRVDTRSLARLAVYAAPENDLERQVAGIWEEVLRVDGIGREDNFFDLGGHSLLAFRIVSQIRARLHVDLPLVTVFERPTVSGLAAAVDRHGAATRPGERTPG